MRYDCQKVGSNEYLIELPDEASLRVLNATSEDEAELIRIEESTEEALEFSSLSQDLQNYIRLNVLQN